MKISTESNGGHRFENLSRPIREANMETVKTKAEEQLRITSSQIDQLERENGRLVEQLKEVMKMNTHWQRYDSQREEYVLKLSKTNQELQDKVSDLEHEIEDLGIFKGLSGGKKEDFRTKEPLQSTHKRDEATCTEQAELDAMRKEEEVAALTDSIAKLKDRIVELEIGRESRKKEDNDQLEMLREQINVCVEDFNQERKDRERIHADNLKLRKHLALAENQIRVYGDRLAHFQKPHQRVSRPPPRGGYDVPCCYPEDRPHRAPFAPYEGHPGEHRPQNTRYRHPVYFGDDLTDLPRDVEIDGEILDDVQTSTDADDLPIVSETDGKPCQKTTGGENGIYDEEKAYDVPPECPRCLASFKSDSELLQHINKCMD